MTRSPLAALLRHIRQAVPPSQAVATDADLLRRYTRQHDRDALSVLVGRYGPLVWRVCRRFLSPADAEDAFQATVVVLARRADSIRKPEALAAFLHGVACRLARRAATEVRRRPPEGRATQPRESADPGREAAWRELGQILEEEVARLPEALRSPLLLCYWQGQSNEEAARRLGWPSGTVKTRLARARQLLHARLLRRGVALPAGVAALLLAPDMGATAMPRCLLQQAVGRLEHLPASARALAEAALQATAGVRLPLLLAVVLAVGAAVGVGQLAGTATPAKPAAEPPSLACAHDAVEPLPAGAGARLGTTRFRHSEKVWCLAFSPDGKTLASGGLDEVVRFWDPKTGRQLRTSARLSGGAVSLAFSPDGATVAARDWGERCGASLLDAASGRERLFAALPTAGRGNDGAVAFSPDGAMLAATSPAGEVFLCDARSGKSRAALGRHDHDNVPRLAFSPDGQTLASAGQDAAIRLWDVKRGKALSVLRSEDTCAFSIVFSHDGKQLISGGGIQEFPNKDDSWKAPTIRVWDVATGKQLRVYRDEAVRGCTCSLALAPDGRTLAGTVNAVLRLWDLKEGKPLRSFAGPRSRHWPVSSLCFSPDGKLLAGALDNTVAVWETASGRLLNLTPQEPAGGIRAVAVSGDGRLLAAGSSDGLLSLWDLRTRRLVRPLRAHSNPIDKVAFSPDDKTVVSTCPYDCLRAWEVSSGRQLYQFPAQPPKGFRLGCLTFSPDGKLLATAYFSDRQGGGPRGIRLLDAATGVERQNLTIDEAVHGWFVGVAFSADGQHLIGTTVNGETFGWRRKGDRFLEKVELPATPFGPSLAYCADGFLVLDGLQSKACSYRDLLTGKPKYSLVGLPPMAGNLAFSRDGRYFAAGPGIFRGGDPKQPRDDVLRLCEMASGREVLHWRLPPNTGVHALAFSPDDRTLIAAMSDTTVLLWDVFPASAKAADDLAALWADLGGEATRGHRAVAGLLQAGDRGVAFLTAQLQPSRPPDPGQLDRWVADLDSDEYAVREQATQRLARAAEMARHTLIRARHEAGLEKRRRIDLLLAKLDSPVLTGDTLRGVRAVTVLESLATPAARQLLRRLAEGAPELRLTREARSACRRLAKQPLPAAEFQEGEP